MLSKSNAPAQGDLPSRADPQRREHEGRDLSRHVRERDARDAGHGQPEEAVEGDRVPEDGEAERRDVDRHRVGGVAVGPEDVGLGDVHRHEEGPRPVDREEAERHRAHLVLELVEAEHGSGEEDDRGADRRPRRPP